MQENILKRLSCKGFGFKREVIPKLGAISPTVFPGIHPSLGIGDLSTNCRNEHLG